MQKNVTIPQIDPADVFQNINLLEFNYFYTGKIFLDREWNTEYFPAGRQINSMCRLYMPLQGEGLGVIGKTRLHFRKGSLYLIPPFANVHLSCNAFLEKYWAHFNALLPDSKVDIFNRIEYPLEVPAENMEFLIHCFEILISHQDALPEMRHQPERLAKFECRCAMGMLLKPFLLQAEKLNKIPDRNKSRITDIIYYVEHNLSEKLTLEKLAGVFNFNANYLSNYFSAEIGMGLIHYIRLRLVEKAKLLLKDPALSIKQIADLLGFEDPRTFSRAFKRVIYMTPTQYRNLLKSHFPNIAGNTLLPRQ